MGTPGRLDDLVSTGKLSLSQVRFLVLDEAVSVFYLIYLYLAFLHPAGGFQDG